MALNQESPYVGDEVARLIVENPNVLQVSPEEPQPRPEPE